MENNANQTLRPSEGSFGVDRTFGKKASTARQVNVALDKETIDLNDGGEDTFMNDQDGTHFDDQQHSTPNVESVTESSKSKSGSSKVSKNGANESGLKFEGEKFEVANIRYWENFDRIEAVKGMLKPRLQQPNKVNAGSLNVEDRLLHYT
ncbi:hypothetical protein SESBI_50637 [Sesbania bispinosa]|nr:hypothetical protein SESBI_50637 [Sesbania bispinosa]